MLGKVASVFNLDKQICIFVAHINDPLLNIMEMMDLSNRLKQKKSRQARRDRKDLSLRVLREHLSHKSSPRLLELCLSDKRMAQRALNQEMDREMLGKVINSIHKLGDELLVEGAYLEVINYFKEAANTVSELGFQQEAMMFSERALKIYDLLRMRAEFLTQLEREKSTQNWSQVIVLYHEIIEISKKLNDAFWVDEFQKELNHIRNLKTLNKKNTETFASKSILKTMEKIRDLFNTDHEDLFSSNISKNIQSTAIDDLEEKRRGYEEKAKYLAKNALFKSAAQFYEFCEEISLQLFQLGRSQEQNNINRYRRKKIECLNK